MRKIICNIALAFAIILMHSLTAQSQNGELILSFPDLNEWTCEIGETQTFVWKYNYTADGFDKECDDIDPGSVELSLNATSGDQMIPAEVVGRPSVTGCFVTVNFVCNTDDPFDIDICVTGLSGVQSDDGVACSNISVGSQEDDSEVDTDSDGVADTDDCAPNDPNASGANDPCDDGDANTINDQYDDNCNCSGQVEVLDADGDGVADANDCAPNDPNASCANDPCDDGDESTSNDQYDNNCNCSGQIEVMDADGDGVADADDCAPDDPNASSRFDPCDDGDATTTNDQYDSNCNCRGQATDTDGDGVADADDCAPDDPNASSRFDPCDDGDATTINDQYDSNCNCRGQVTDSDGDGVIDTEDCAPDDPNASSRFDPCDDGNPNTFNDQYDSNCNCRGRESDTDGDGVVDSEDCAPNDPSASSRFDPCDDGDVNTENDRYDSNCNCRGQEPVQEVDSDGDGVFDANDCDPNDPNVSSRFDPCDDGDPNTVNDQYDSNCNCRGQARDTDGDGVPDDEDCAPDDPNASSRFDPCDDGNAATVSDQYDSNCNCRGRLADSDGDGVDDDEDCAPDDPNASGRFDPCDDDDANTVNDQYDSNCNCRGQVADSDGDGVADNEDCAPDDPNASSRFDPCDDGDANTVNDQYDSNCNCRGEEPTLTVEPSESVVFFDLNDCFSRTNLGADDYSEFTASNPTQLACATFSSSTLMRDNPTENKHSCTPGAEGTAAMCMSTRSECDYSSDEALAFEVQVDATDIVSITGLNFLEKAPEQYDWLGGTSGPNDYPTKYGVRILVDGAEVFFEDDISTSRDWTAQSFSFDNILIEGSAIVRVEMLGYCPVGNGAVISAWDVENIELTAACGTSSSSALISGLVTAMDNSPLSDVLLTVEGDDFQDQIMTSANGKFSFEGLSMSSEYTLSANKTSDFLKGVSTLDLVFMLDHILGLDPFDEAYKYIAADVDNNQRIGAMDVVQLRNLILGVIDELPANNSYRFYDQNETMNMSNPWIAQEGVQFFDSANLGSVSQLLGIKVGDVNFRQTETRSSGNAVLHYEVRNSDNANFKVIDFFFETEEEFKAIQLNLLLRNSNLVSLESGQLEVPNGNYNFVDNHELRISQNFDEVINFDPKKPMFSLVVESNQTADHINLIQDIQFESELYSSAKDARSIQIKATVTKPAGVQSVQVYPNPFSDVLLINLNLEDEQAVNVDLFDLNGRLIKSFEQTLSQGENVIRLDDLQQVTSSTVLISRVAVGNEIYTNRIVRIKE